MKWEIEFYEDNNSDIPLDNFLDSLPIKEQTKIAWTIDLLERTGINLTLPYAKHIEDKIWELRIQNNRILYFLKDKTFILLHGFKKKTNKLPKKEKNIATIRMKDYLERCEKNG